MYQYEFIVNGYPVHAQYSEQFINDIAMPLLETWSRMANDKQVLVFLGGASRGRQINDGFVV